MRWRHRRKATREQAHEITLQESLMAARMHQGVTRQQVATEMGITVEDVLAFERGETDPRMSELRRYAMAARVLTEWTVIAPVAARRPADE